jgi:AcrR family transcriptional regulator
MYIKDNSNTIINQSKITFFDYFFYFYKNYWLMYIDFTAKLNERLFLKDPQSTELGKKIIKEAISMIAHIGYEQFTFKKLANEIETTEATIYRYFVNKHKLLIYLVDWYWAYLEFQIVFQLNNITEPAEKIKKVIDILVWEDNAEINFGPFDHQALYFIAIAEGNKTYLSKDVDENNKDMLYKPFKDLSGRIASIFLEYNPDYKYPNTLASSVIDLSHLQYFFMHHLPRLSDFAKKKKPKDIEAFLEDLVFKTLG